MTLNLEDVLTVRTVADLGVRHLGGTVRTNGFVGDLQYLGIADDPAYIEVGIQDPENGSVTSTWVRPDMPAAVTA